MTSEVGGLSSFEFNSIEDGIVVDAGDCTLVARAQVVVHREVVTPVNVLGLGKFSGGTKTSWRATKRSYSELVKSRLVKP